MDYTVTLRLHSFGVAIMKCRIQWTGDELTGEVVADHGGA